MFILWVNIIIMIWVKNGGHVSYMFFIILYLSNNMLLASALTLRLFTINYFYWFSKWSIQGQLRQFVRFTDSQTLVCLLNWWFDKTSIIGELTYNVLALVSFGFWIAKMVGIDETLSPPIYPFYQREINKLYHYINHGLLFLLFSIQTPPLYGFTHNGINRTLLFLLFYIMLIYIPWYFFTGDRIYDV
jgi:hypothetical protein